MTACFAVAPEIDVRDPDLYLVGVPHERFRRLREIPSLYRHFESGGPGFWAVTRHADIVEISRAPGLFSSRAGVTLEDLPSADVDSPRSPLVTMDPPRHGRYRRLVSHAFSSRAVAVFEPGIRRAVTAILDHVASRGRCDFVHDVAAPLPLAVIGELMGIPDSDRPRIRGWTERMVGVDDPTVGTSRRAAKLAAAEMWLYARELVAKRRHAGGRDLVTELLAARLDDRPLSEPEFNSFFLHVLIAGNETARNVMANGMLHLIRHPTELASMRANRRLMPSAVEEMLRYFPPVIYMRRTATRDVNFHGTPVRAGDKLALYYAAANRDEAVFPDPDRFDVGREPNDHLAFGAGEHSCIGATLARLEMRVLFEEILERFAGIRLAGPVRRLRSNFVDGLTAMPVAFARSIS